MHWWGSFHFFYVTDKITLTLQVYFHQKWGSIIYLQFCEYFLWVRHLTEVNSFPVSSKQVKRFEGKLNICWGKKFLPELAVFKVNAWGQKHNHSKSSCGYCKPQIAWLVWLLCLFFTHSTSKLNFENHFLLFSFMGMSWVNFQIKIIMSSQRVMVQ